MPYAADLLTGLETIDGYRLDCISPEWLVKFPMRYDLDKDDSYEVLAVYKRFGIALPDEYDECVMRDSQARSEHSPMRTA